jgi:hypothetical protein
MLWPALITRISVAPANAPTSFACSQRDREIERSSRELLAFSSENTQLPLAKDHRVKLAGVWVWSF